MTGQSDPLKKESACLRSREDAEKLFLANMKLVPFVANGMAIEVTEDTIQDGYIGLWRAALLFDESYGTKFTTFAVPAIRHSIILEWRRRSRSIQADYSMEQPLFWGGDDFGIRDVSETVEDTTASTEIEDAETKIYMQQVLTDSERELETMLENGMTKTAIGKHFGHTDMWAYYHIGLIRKKLEKDFTIKKG